MALSSHEAGTGRTRRWWSSPLAWCAVVLSASLFLTACPGPGPSTFVTQPFCQGFYSAPFHASVNDRCYATSWGGSFMNTLLLDGGGQEHSGCVDAVDASWNLVTNWACQVPGVAAYLYFDGTRWMNGVVRNNHPNLRTHLFATQSGYVYP